jgi:hypothetical protein
VQSFWMNRPYQVEHQGIFSGDYAYIRINKSSTSVTYKSEIADFLEIDSLLIRKIYKEIYVKYERINILE